MRDDRANRGESYSGICFGYRDKRYSRRSSGWDYAACIPYLSEDIPYLTEDMLEDDLFFADDNLLSDPPGEPLFTAEDMQRTAGRKKYTDIPFEEITLEAERMMQKAGKLFPEEMTIEDMGLSVRSFNCLKRAGYDTAGSVARAGRSELAKIRNMGKKSLDEITQKVEELGLIMPD